MRLTYWEYDVTVVRCPDPADPAAPFLAALYDPRDPRPLDAPPLGTGTGPTPLAALAAAAADAEARGRDGTALSVRATPVAPADRRTARALAEGVAA